MKRLAGLFTAFFIAVSSSLHVAAATPLPDIRSETYIVMDAATGQVLLERGAHNRMFPASITKILTCALALEHAKETGGGIDDRHTMTYEAVHSIDRGSTHIALTQEENVTVRDLLNATMIESANDAANGLAEYTAGSLDAFPPLMNEKAAELGAVDSHFVNGNGLHDNEHYTSAYDMALITKWALGIDGFRELFGATEYIVPATNKQPVERKMGTHHHMLVDSQYYYEGTTGGKLGWTPEARHTLVTLAKRDGLELICVVMRTSTQFEKYDDAAALLDACFADYAAANMAVAQYVKGPIPVLDGEKKVGEVAITSTELSLARPAAVARADIKGELIAPERYVKGEVIAPSIRFTDRTGKQLASVPLAWEYREIAPPSVPVTVPTDDQAKAAWVRALGERMLSLSPWKVTGLVLLVVVAALLIYRQHNLKNRKKRRMERRAKRAEAAADVIDVAPEFVRKPAYLSPAEQQRQRIEQLRLEQQRFDQLRQRNASRPRRRGK